MFRGRDGAILYSNMERVIDFSKEFIMLYAEKLLGAALDRVRIVSWLPWEMLIPSGNRVSANSHVITYRSLSTVCFTYVKKMGEDDLDQRLSYISNMYTISSSHTTAGIVDGQTFSKTVDKTSTTYADSYASGSRAADHSAYMKPDPSVKL